MQAEEENKLSTPFREGMVVKSKIRCAIGLAGNRRVDGRYQL